MPVRLISLALFLVEASSVDVSSVTFNLTNARTAIAGRRLNEDTYSYVDPSKTTVFLVHGFAEDSRKPYYTSIPEAYMRKGGYNVITVDWGALAKRPYIIISTVYLEDVARRIAEVIKILHEQYRVSLKEVHIIGHSLGAHIAGFVGKSIFQDYGEKIKKIIGLDPAGPLFNIRIKAWRLSKGDADMVLVLHTDILLFGTRRDLGTINFYANGGFWQPSCPFDTDKYTAWNFCSHQRSVSYFIESIHSDNFVAYNCNDTSPIAMKIRGCNGSRTIFGDSTPFGLEGRYYFSTHKTSPYGKGG